ncbi:MAG: AI-2E family transporter [Desulfomonile sp.]
MVEGSDINRTTQTACLMILTAIAVAVALYWLKPAVVPFIWAFFLSVVLGPAVKLQVHYLRFPRALALIVTLGLVLMTISVVGGIIASSIADFAANSSQYEQTVERLIRQAESAGLLKTFGITLPEELNFAALLPAGSLRGVILRMTNAIMSALSRGMIVILFAAFLLAGYTLRQEPPQGFLGEMEASVKQYVSTKVLVSAVTGMLVFSVLALLGIPYAISFGAFAFVLNFIPTIGSVLATILPIPIILIMPGISTTSTVLAVALPGLIQIVIGSVLEPKIMGKSLDLHPITVLLALIFWGMIWGFEGLILGVPITAIIRIILEKLKMTAPVAHLMAGRLEKGWAKGL